MTYYKKQTADGETLVKALDENGNYSIASDRDPEPSGYTNHAWGADVAEWHEISAVDASSILGYELA